MRREPDMGFDPRSPGSHPRPKAGTKPLRHRGIPIFKILKRFWVWLTHNVTLLSGVQHSEHLIIYNRASKFTAPG